MLRRIKSGKENVLTKKFCKENGQSMVEFAIILPVLLLIVFGVIDFGWLFYNQSALNNSAREGARYAVVNTAIEVGHTAAERDADIRAKVLAVSPSSITTDMVTTITYSDTNNNLLGDVTILVTTNVKILTPLMGIFSSNQQKAIHAHVTMRVET